MECAGVSACEHRGQPKTTKLFPCAHLVFGLCRASSGNKDFHKRSAIIANIHPRDDASFLQLKKKKQITKPERGVQGVQVSKVCRRVRCAGAKKGPLLAINTNMVNDMPATQWHVVLSQLRLAMSCACCR